MTAKKKSANVTDAQRQRYYLIQIVDKNNTLENFTTVKRSQEILTVLNKEFSNFTTQAKAYVSEYALFVDFNLKIKSLLQKMTVRKLHFICNDKIIIVSRKTFNKTKIKIDAEILKAVKSQ